MRLPPSVVSLIESHLGLPLPNIKSTSFRASAANLQPLVPGRPTPTPKFAPTPTATRTPDFTTRRTFRRTQTNREVISLEEALQRYPTKPQVALGVAHRLLNEQASAPFTSSRVDYILKRQQAYEHVIKIFASYPESANVTIASIYQRLVNEDLPPTSVILKVVLGTALKNGISIMPILRGLIGKSGLPEEMDLHLLLLVIKGLAREVNIEPKELERVIDDCLRGKERGIGFDEILVESYGLKGDLRGMVETLSKHTNKPPARGVLSLYLQALNQWIGNPSLRQKRRGSLFPRALAKDLITIYGGADKLPLEWLNAWMNGERIANNLQTALNVWTVIKSSQSPDERTYSIYFRLMKLLPYDEGKYRLREVVRDIFDPNSSVELNSEILEHALGAAFTHHDLPLVLLLARHLDHSPDQHLNHKISPSARVIDILAAGQIRFQRPPLQPGRTRSNAITTEEWTRVTRLVNSEREAKSEIISLPLNTPRAGLIDDIGAGGDYVGRFKPGSRTQFRASIVRPLVNLIERAVILQHRNGRGDMKDDEILRVVMKEVNSEILPTRQL